MPGLTDATEIVDYPTSELLERPDGSFLRVRKLNHRGTSFGAVLIGPFFKAGSSHEVNGEIPEITEEQQKTVVNTLKEALENCKAGV